MPSDRRRRPLTDPVSRRTALKLLGGGAVSLYLSASFPPLWLGGCTRKPEGTTGPGGAAPELFLMRHGPVDRTLLGDSTDRFSGDEPVRPHSILWDRAAFLAARGGDVPRQPQEQVPLVIIGGGVGGLASAYLLRDKKPVVLEQAPRFGGNSRGESWRGIEYGIGAAYFCEPEAGSRIHGFLKEVGFERWSRLVDERDAVALKGRLFPDFWSGATDPRALGEFEKIAQHLRNVAESQGGQIYPEVPYFEDAAMRERVHALDRVSFREHLKTVAGKRIHPHIETYFEHYCWSSLGGSLNEVSAACALNFVAAELDTVRIARAGNGTLAEALLEKVLASVPSAHLRPSSLVYDVSVDSDGVNVQYEDASTGKLHSLLAQAAIVACPKFVAKRIVRDLEPERQAAIAGLRYRSYLVANVLLKSPSRSFYDLFLLGEGAGWQQDRRVASRKTGATDVILANYAVGGTTGPGGETVLTLYRALPYDGARPELLADGAHDRIRAEFVAQIERDVLPLLGLTPAAVAGIRLARWGHPLPLASVGQIASGAVERLRRPFKDRVFWVQQDNWMLPAMETAVMEALHWAPQVDKLLKS